MADPDEILLTADEKMDSAIEAFRILVSVCQELYFLSDCNITEGHAWNL